MCEDSVYELYQTLQNKGNNDEIERHGPYWCNRSDAWLGSGYYMWEDIYFAHKWGKESYQGCYVIGETAYDFYSKDYLNLYGNRKHEKSFLRLWEKLQKIDPEQDITVSGVLDYIRKRYKGKLPYKAIRTRSEWRRNEFCISYGFGKKAELNLMPQVQLCVIDKSFLTKDFKITYISGPQIRPYI